jgi:[acyl-carrier-protein] S-malonyltransferase
MPFQAVVFPGQGSQRVGMAMDFVEKFTESADVFKRANQFLDFDVLRVCREDEEKLNITEFTQPCILTTEVAMFQAIVAQDKNFKPIHFGGHSLGEYAALVAAGVIPFEDAIKIVAKRGALMHHCMEEGQGAMAAVIMEAIPYDTLEALANQHQVDLANDNSQKQVVLSGLANDIDVMVNVLEEEVLKAPTRCVKLNVSAAFHSRHMRPIETEFKDYLNQFKENFVENKLPSVVSNYSGDFYTSDKRVLVESLTQQLSHTVRWRDNMQAIVNKTKDILEVGPHRPLKSFFKTLDVEVISIMNVKNFDKILIEAKG